MFDFKMIKVQGKLCRQEVIITDQICFDLTTPKDEWSFWPVNGQTKPIRKNTDEIESSQDDLNIVDGLYNYQAKKNKIVYQGLEIKMT